jgi:hypothetical protein
MFLQRIAIIRKSHFAFRYLEIAVCTEYAFILLLNSLMRKRVQNQQL